jgi:predicted Zn-dependent protease
MYKILLALVMPLLFVSCALKEPKVIKANEKAFEQEDTYILFALRAQQLKNYKAASKLFETLYENSNKKEYLYRSLENDLVLKDNEKVIKKVDEITKGSLDDVTLIRLKVVALYESNKLQKAKELAVKLARKTHNPNDYLLVSDIYIKRKEYDLALKYLEGAYIKEYNEKILDKMSIILYVNLHRTKEAIAQLETHSRMHGCSKLICNRLIGFYSNENNVDGLLSTYLRLYNLDKDKSIAKKIIQIYSYKQDYLKLIDFLEDSNVDDESLLQLYISAKNYKKAYLLAQELHKQTGDISYLGQSAIYEYVNFKDNLSKEILSDVIYKLEKVSKEKQSPLYLNYLGYILIDHNIDIKKGMNYIKKVLKIQPNSAYYLDSLAWGYFKLGNCVKAKRIIDKVVKLDGGDDPEVISHLNQINECLNKNEKVKDKK